MDVLDSCLKAGVVLITDAENEVTNTPAAVTLTLPPHDKQTVVYSPCPPPKKKYAPQTASPCLKTKTQLSDHGVKFPFHLMIGSLVLLPIQAHKERNDMNENIVGLATL